MPIAPRLAAAFYASSSGNEPVRDWLKSLPKDDRRTVGEDIAYVQYKWPIGKPHVDHLRGAIWEVRSTLKQNIARTLFAIDGNKMILLHAFIKKTQQTPTNEIALAEKRLKEYQHGKT
jgi:phage-related protein